MDQGPVDPVGRGGHHDVVDRTVRCLEPAALPHHVHLAGPVDLRGRQRRGPEVPGDQGGQGLRGEDRSAPGLSTIGAPDGERRSLKPQVRMLSEMFPICSFRCHRVCRAPEAKRTLLIDVGGEGLAGTVISDRLSISCRANNTSGCGFEATVGDASVRGLRVEGELLANHEPTAGGVTGRAS